MSKLKNAPLVEVVFEIKWGKTTQKGNDLLIEFSQEEQSLMPGKFQIFAENKGFGLLEVIENQPPIPHLVKYRYREKPGSYPLYQLGNGVFTVNQIDFDGYNYDWDIFKTDIERGVTLLEKSYPFNIKKFPLMEIQLRYRDVVLSQENESLVDFVNNKLEIGNIALPEKLIENENIKTDLPMGSVTLQVECVNPIGQLVCQVNPGIHKNQKSFVVDFIVVSKANAFPQISYESLVDWCVNAHNHHRIIFSSIYNDLTMQSFDGDN
jgi:uncharacterized protein (TIGR04255 family)